MQILNAGKVIIEPAQDEPGTCIVIAGFEFAGPHDEGKDAFDLYGEACKLALNFAISQLQYKLAEVDSQVTAWREAGTDPGIELLGTI